MVLYTVVALSILSIFVCHFIAKRRGANPVFWGLMGAIFGPLAIPFAFLSRPQH
jgi:energy-coupling factor transporter transmembrane protein EcfT